MDYKKEKLEEAKKLYASANDDQKYVLESLFPELAESEDERIRKEFCEDIWTFIPNEKAHKYIAWLEKRDKDKKEVNNFDVLPGLYKCVHRMFDGTPNGRLLFEVGNVYKCLSKHDRAEFEVSHGHSVYLEDPVVCKHFIPFEEKNEPKSANISIKEKAHQIAWEMSKHYDPLLSKESWCEMAALDMASWLEKQDIFSKKDIDDAYLKGIGDTKNELEKQYEANYQIRKDIATFIFNYKGDIKDRAKWMNYLGIKVSFVDEQGEKRHKFIIGDIISDNNNAIYRVDNIVKNCIGQDCYFLVNVEMEKKGNRYLKSTDSNGKTHNFGERTCICEQIDAKFEKQSERNSI